LKQNVGRVWEIVVADNKLPDPPALQSIDLPDEFKKGTLAQRIGNIVKAIVLSKHQAESVNAIKAIVERYIGARLRVGIRIQFVESRDGDPVIALSGEKIYCRRYLGDGRDPSSRVALACDRSGTDRVPPTLLLTRANTRLLPIIGILYDQEIFDGKEEACPVAACKLLYRNLVAMRVSDENAYPVIGNGDTVLLEANENLNRSEVSRLEDQIFVAVADSAGENFAYLKRLGGEISPGIRIL
jgi:hypothetical protein